MSAASSSSAKDSSAVAALTTTFTPATTCSGLTFSAPIYSIWYNEPVPAVSITESGCYPSQFLQGYISLSASSIAPALSPLVCPLGWTTALSSTSNYVACCPSDYAVHYPDTTANLRRPAYGGLCFSGFTSGITLTVVEYNSTGVVQTQTVPFSTSGQVFAHIIDGFAQQNIAATSQTPGSNGIAGPTATSSSINASSGRSLSGGAIAGIVVGSVVGFAAILALGFFLLRLQKIRHAPAEDGMSEARPALNESAATPIFESDPAAAIAEKDGFPKAAIQAESSNELVELSSGREPACEMEGPREEPGPAELDSPPFALYFEDRDRDQDQNRMDK